MGAFAARVTAELPYSALNETSTGLLHEVRKSSTITTSTGALILLAFSMYTILPLIFDAVNGIIKLKGTNNSAMEEITITKMEPRDRAAIRSICCDTGYAGLDIRPYFDDPELFADIFTLYYTDFEPQSTFVARAGGRTVGYLCGCLDTRRYRRFLAARIVPALLLKALSEGYRLGKKTGRYIRNLLSGLSRARARPPLALYPAHLHINMEAGYRRRGAGAALMNRYFGYLQERAVPGVHLGTTSLNRSALPFYEKMGFRLYSRAGSGLHEGRRAFSLVYIREICRSARISGG